MAEKKSPPQVIIYVFNFAKEYIKHILYVVLTGILTLIFGQLYMSLKSDFQEYSMVPKKIKQLIFIHQMDSSNLITYKRDDSTREAKLHKTLDSITGVANTTRLWQDEDKKAIDKIKYKLKLH